MNIALVLAQKFDPDAGGVQRSTSKLAKIFQSKHHHVIIITLGNHPTKLEQFGTIVLYYININETTQLRDVLKKENIDCIINQMGYSVSLTKLLIKNKDSKTKLINTLRINPLNFYQNHNLFINNVLVRKKLGFLNTYVLRKFILFYHIIKQNIELNYIVKNTSAFVMLSEKFKPELFFLAPRLKKYKEKIYGISNPFQRPTVDISQLEKENIILFVGRLNVLQKRIDLLLQIWKKIHAKEPNWKFWICGDGEEIVNMKKFCKEYKLDRVTFFGKVNPTEYYKKAKIFHMTSAFEGFGNVLIEAQSYGCVPVLFDSYAAASEIIVHKKNGLLISTFNVDKYVEETINLMHDQEKIKVLAENGFENVLRFSYEESYKRWEEVFKSY